MGKLILPSFGRRDLLRGAGVVALTSVAGGLLSACGGGGETAAGPQAPMTAAENALLDAARQEGKVVLYSGSEESIIANLGRAFQARYGIPLEYQRLNSGEIAMRYSAEAQAGRTSADLILSGDHEISETFAQRGWLTNIDPATVPGLSEWPADFKDAHSAIVSIIPYTIGINTDQVKTDPTSWDYLLSPELRGSLVALDVKRVNVVAIAGWDFLLKQKGEAFLRQVGQQQLRLVDSAPSAVQQLGSGAVKAFFPCSMTQAHGLIEQGAPIKTVLPLNTPYTGVMSEVTLSTEAPHPNAAKLFLGFLLSQEGQTILNVVGSSPVTTPGTPPLPPGFVKPDFASTAANRAKIAELLGM